MLGRVSAAGRSGGFDRRLRSPVSALSLLAATSWLAASPAASQVQPSQNPQSLRQVTVETPRPRLRLPRPPRRAPVRRTTPAQPAQVAPAARSPEAPSAGSDAPPPKAASELTFTGADIATRPATR